MGALGYGVNHEAPEKKEVVDGRYLVELQKLARKFEENTISEDEEMALLFQAGSSPGGTRPKALIQEAKYFGIKQQSKAEKIVETMLAKMSNWEKVFREFNVPARDIEIIGKDIEGRMAKITVG